MIENFVLNSDTEWSVDLSDDTNVKLNVTLCRKRLRVETLWIDIAICIDGYSSNRLRVIYSTPDPKDTMAFKIVSPYTSKLYRELSELTARLNKQ